ncbi:MAG: peptide chain release factor N(5)-glutamine methyltransferase [Bacteroidales bacterium]
MGVKIQTIKDIRLYLEEELSGLYPETEIIAFTNIIKTKFRFTKLQMFAFPENPLTGKQASEIKSICRELKTRKPIQYIIGETSFYNCIIKVNPSTLIPRPETEELVDLIIRENRGFTGSLLDIGTGSGAIAIALAVNMPGSSVTATDISESALDTARTNAALNNASVDFIKVDMLDFQAGILQQTDIIVSNPPYVRESEISLMGKNVTGFEPHSALFVPDSDPLKFYVAILKIARNTLAFHGKIYFEINEAFGKEMSLLLDDTGYSEIRIINDINGKQRFIAGIKNG